MASTSKENNMIAENLKNDPWAQYLNIESEDSLISTKATAAEISSTMRISSEYMNFFKLQPFSEEFIVCRCKCLKTLLPPSLKAHIDTCPERANRIHSASHQSNQSKELKYPNGEVNSSKANGKEGKSRQQNNKRLRNVAPSTSNKSIEGDRKSVKKPDPYETSLSGPGPGKKTANSNFCDNTALVSAMDTRLPKAESHSASLQPNKFPDKSFGSAHSNGLCFYGENAVSKSLLINGVSLVNGNFENNLKYVTNLSRSNTDHNHDSTERNRQQGPWSCNYFSTINPALLINEDKADSYGGMENNVYSSPIFSESSSLENNSPTSLESACPGAVIETSSPLSFSSQTERTLDEGCPEQKCTFLYRLTGGGEINCCDTGRNNIQIPLETFAGNASVQNEQKSVCAVDSVFEGGHPRDNSIEVGTPGISRFFSPLICEKRKAPSSENLPSPKRTKLDFHKSDWVSLDNLSKCLDLENTEVQSDKDLEPSANLVEVYPKRLPGQAVVFPSKEPVLNFLTVAEDRSKKLFEPAEVNDALRTYWLPYTSTKNVLNTGHSGNNASKLRNSAVFHTPESSIPEMKCNVNQLLNEGKQSGNSEDGFLPLKSTRLKRKSDASPSIPLRKFSRKSSKDSPQSSQEVEVKPSSASSFAPYHSVRPNHLVTGQTSASRHRVGKIARALRKAIDEEVSRLKSCTKHLPVMTYVPVLHSSSDSGITVNGSEQEIDVECSSQYQNDSSEASSLPERTTYATTHIETQPVFEYDLPMEFEFLDITLNDYVTQSDSLPVDSPSPIQSMDPEKLSASWKDSSIDLTSYASPEEVLETSKTPDAVMPNGDGEISRVFNKTVAANDPYHLEPLFISKHAYPTTPPITIAPGGLRNNTVKGEKNRRDR